MAFEDKSNRRVLRFNWKALFGVVLLSEQDMKSRPSFSALVFTKLTKQTRIKIKTRLKEAVECLLVFDCTTMMDVVMLVLL